MIHDGDGKKSVADRRGLGGFKLALPEKKNHHFIWAFPSDLVIYRVRNSAQYALDCIRKPLEIKNFPGGGPLDPFTVKYFLSNCKPPPPLTGKLDPPLERI